MRCCMNGWWTHNNSRDDANVASICLGNVLIWFLFSHNFRKCRRWMKLSPSKCSISFRSSRLRVRDKQLKLGIPKPRWWWTMVLRDNGSNADANENHSETENRLKGKRLTVYVKNWGVWRNPQVCDSNGSCWAPVFSILWVH